MQMSKEERERLIFGLFAHPTVGAIKGKFTKRYEPQGKLKLLAYIDGNPMFPEEIWLADLDDLLAGLDGT